MNKIRKIRKTRNTRKTHKTRKTRKTKNNKHLKTIKKQNGGADPFSFKGKKICGDRFDLYFNDVFASSNNYVYSLCKDRELNNCNETLAKIYDLRYWKKKPDIDKEAEYMRIASNLGVSPEFFGIEYCNYDGKEYAILIMQNYGSGNLTNLLRHNYYEENEDAINRQIKQILDTLYDNNIDHRDLHSDNFLYRMKENGDIEFKIIDFDTTNLLNSKKRNYTIQNLNKYEEIVDGKKVIEWGSPINVE